MDRIVQEVTEMEAKGTYAFPLYHRIGRAARPILASRYWIVVVLIVATLLYSPFLFSSPKRWGPYRQQANVLLPQRETCTKCAEDRCKEYNCMASIRPQTVLDKAIELLSPRPEGSDR